MVIAGIGALLGGMAEAMQEAERQKTQRMLYEYYIGREERERGEAEQKARTEQEDIAAILQSLGFVSPTTIPAVPPGRPSVETPLTGLMQAIPQPSVKRPTEPVLPSVSVTEEAPFAPDVKTLEALRIVLEERARKKGTLGEKVETFESLMGRPASEDEIKGLAGITIDKENWQIRVGRTKEGKAQYYGINAKTGEMKDLGVEAFPPRPLVSVQVGKPTTFTERKEIATLRTRIKDLTEFKIAHGKISDKLGPVQGRAKFQLYDKAGGKGLTSEEAEYFAYESAIRNTIIQLITGAAVGVQEAKRIMRQIPSHSDTPAQWTAKWEVTRQNSSQLLQEIENMARESGFVVPKAVTPGEVGRGIGTIMDLESSDIDNMTLDEIDAYEDAYQRGDILEMERILDDARSR